MGLADAIAAARKQPGGKCTVGKLRSTLTAADLQALDAALADPDVSSGQIIDGLRAEGHEATRSPIDRHRRGECACGTR